MRIENQLDSEIEKIFAEAEASVKYQTKIGINREDWRDKTDFSAENPEEAHRLYFKSINRLLRKFVYPILPKGKGRTQLHEVKNLLLNYGKKKNSQGIRGSSGQMSHNITKQMVLDIVQDWVVSDGKATFNLYVKLRDKNVELGYITKRDNI